MENKMIYNCEEDKTKIKNRLSKIEGQINGIKKMIDQERGCDEVLIQLLAIDKALKGVSDTLFEDYMRNNIKELSIKKQATINEIINLFKKF